MVECINGRLGKWRVRWDVRPHTNEGLPSDTENHGVSFVETEFKHKPTLDDVKAEITASGTEASVSELRTISRMLDGNALAFLKDMTEDMIMRHDSSSAVNSFTLAGATMWLPKETRVGLVNSINIEKTAGKETTTLWFDAVQYDIPVDTALQMLAALELYALDCYNVTHRHIARVREMLTEEEITAYDYTAGYPLKPTFNL